jgi:hypothetical protein
MVLGACFGACSSEAAGPMARGDAAGDNAGGTFVDDAAAEASGGSAGGVLEGSLTEPACTPPTSESSCDTFPQCGCELGQKCDIVDIRTGHAQCFADAPVLPYQPCIGTSKEFCIRGTTCIGGVCKPFCQSADDCPGVRRECLQVELFSAGVATAVPGLFVCTAACDPIDPVGTCGPGLGCFFTSDSGPGTDCFGTDSAVGAGACAAGESCAPGYVCVDQSDCLKWCRVGNPNDCGTDACGGLLFAPTIDGVQYGVCPAEPR